MSAPKPLRCAVYTRKSTEDGLEQEFNSLHAQREACEAYILSQKHEGWTLLDAPYDDGGFSGGNMERPGLKNLLKDVESGLVDVIVVYKVDRLTRSLADFAKIVELLDANEASFVSVTQAFNTTNSMGRLTLNVLLSFAQFEREVTGERIRDKIAASKKKGLWMGGPIPLGYEVVERKLVPVPEEAERVRTIMRGYLVSASANDLIFELEEEGIRTKIQRRTSGPHRGGIPFRRGSLFYLLKNPIYRGKIVHKGEVYKGEHEAIVDEDLWKQVQAKLNQKAPPRKRKTNDKQKAMLRGLLIDPEGRPMVPTYTTKGSRRYAYYESRKDLARSHHPPATRFGQAALETHLLRELTKRLEDQHQLRRWSNSENGAQLEEMYGAAAGLLQRLKRHAERADTLKEIIDSIAIAKDEMRVCLRGFALGLDADNLAEWRMPLPERKPFREAKIRIDAAPCGKEIDTKIVALIGEAIAARELAMTSLDLSLNQIAKREGRCRKQLTKLVRLSWLSPKIIEAIVEGRTPQRVTRKQLLEADLPLNWSDQELLLGFAG